MLPMEFSTPRVDEQGRTYVIHEPTGVRYFVREKAHPVGKVTTYSRNPDAGAVSRPATARKPPRRYVGASAAPEPSYARATFIEGSEPKC